MVVAGGEVVVEGEMVAVRLDGGHQVPVPEMGIGVNAEMDKGEKEAGMVLAEEVPGSQVTAVVEGGAMEAVRAVAEDLEGIVPEVGVEAVREDEMAPVVKIKITQNKKAVHM